GNTSNNFSNNLSAGTYTVTISDKNNCSVIETYTINSNAPYNVTLNAVDPTCNGFTDGKAYATVSISGVTYSWSNGGITDTIKNIGAGTYTVTVTDPISGCTETASIIVNEPAGISANIITKPASCIPGNDGSATINTVVGGKSPFVYNWGAGNTTNNSNNNLNAGAFTVTITDSKGCMGVENYIINQNAPFNLDLDSINITCFGLSNGKAYATVSKTGVTYNWSNGGNTDTISGLSAGIYTVTVTDPVSACFVVKSIRVNEPTRIILSVNKTNESCSPGNDGTASASATGGTMSANYTYNWSTGATGPNINNLAAGNYSVTVTDDNGCTTSQTFSIQGGSPILPNEFVTDETCSGNCDGSITLNPSGGTGIYTYSWNTGETTRIRTNLCGGTYTVTISDGGNCDTTISLTINSNSPLTAVVSTFDQSCTNLTVCDGEAYVTPSGGLAPYTFSWPSGTITGVTSDTAKSLCVGNYAVTISDASGCELVKNYTINGPPPIVANFNITQPACNIPNGAVTVIASGGSSSNYTFEWFNSSLTSIGNTNSINSISSGLYYVDIADGTGCFDRFSVAVSDIGSEAVTITKNDASCFGACDGQATASFVCLDPSCTIEWFNATTSTSLGITTSTANNLCAGDYYVIVTNNSGCKAIETISIGQANQFLVSANLTNPSCFGAFNGSINLNVSGGSGTYSYVWSPGPIAGQGTANASQLLAGKYTVVISDANGCDTTLTYTLTDPAQIKATFSTIDATCGQADGFINAVITGGTVIFDYDYQWFDAASVLLVGQINPNISNVAAGIYYLRVTDDNGCEETFLTTLGNTNGPTITVDSINNVTCLGDQDGAIYTTVTGANNPFTYNWLPFGHTTGDIQNLKAGSYTISVSDNLGCVAFDTATVTGPDEILVNIAYKEANCGLCNGEAKLNVTGGTAPYTYLWSNGSTLDSATALCGGVYTAVVTDAIGCSKTVNITINTTGGPTGESVSITPASCASSCDGRATVTPIGGIAPYTYLWLHNGATSNTQNNLCPGNYTLQVSDVKGCSRVVNIEINSPAAMSLQSNIIAQTCNSIPCDGSIRLDVKGGTKPYSYTWGPSALSNSNVQNGLCAGIYYLTVSDANGCQLEKTLTLPNNGNQYSTIPSITDVTCNSSCDGSLISNIGPIITGVTFQWFNDRGLAVSPINSDLINAACAGDYYLEITDITSGCKTYIDATVEEPDSILLGSSIVKNISCNGACDGEIFISTTGGNILYQYSWNDPNMDGIPVSGLCAGTYALTATDANGCTATTSVTLTDPPALTVNILSSTNLSCSSDCDASANVSASGGSSPYTFNWSGGQIGTTPNTLCFGLNTVTVTDATGCSNIATVNISATDTVVAQVPASGIVCSGDSIYLDGTIIGSTVTNFAWYIDNTSTLFTKSEDTTIYRSIGDYKFYLIASNGSCTDTSEYLVSVVSNPVVGLASSIKIFKDEIAAFKLSGTKSQYSYLWTPGFGLNDSTIAEPFAAPKKTLLYTLTVTDTTGCSFVDSILVDYTPEIKIPSGITPNGDGVNDKWEIDFLEEFPNAKVMIYNRWGALVFEQSNGYKVAWDGTYEGKALPIGTYYYVIDLNSKRFEPFTGPITIVK
ncbi:MAG: gliding motility-associated C-terminal domain-containing protein, partial [Flavobacteriales bacterium]|nr:gliding motility-associated C-terminal domain-containing protein [Flavobacteriales bacterium]